MRKTILLLGAALLAAGLFLWAQRAAVPVPQVGIGGKASNVRLATLSGESVSLYDYAGVRGTLVLFVATRCPVSNDYNQRMADLPRDYLARGFAVIGINANRTEPPDEAARHASEHRLGFTILKDPESRVADYLGASVTPEAYLFDPGWVLRYHGRIDDSRNIARVSAQDVRAALDALAAGKPVEVPETKAFGCTIKRVERP